MFEDIARWENLHVAYQKAAKGKRGRQEVALFEHRLEDNLVELRRELLEGSYRPIGNLTSQFWGNVYLDPLDHFIKRSLRCPGYVRYVDDLLLFADDKRLLWRWKDFGFFPELNKWRWTWKSQLWQRG